MISKDLYEDTTLANSEQTNTVSKAVAQYYATGFLPIAELNRRESAGGESQQEAEEKKESEPLFGKNIRGAIQSIKGMSHH